VFFFRLQNNLMMAISFPSINGIIKVYLFAYD